MKQLSGISIIAGILFLSACNFFSREKVYVNNQEVNPDSADLDLALQKSLPYKLKTVSLTDSSLSGDKFLTCIIPAAWNFNYYTKWVESDNQFPFKFAFQASDTNNVECFTHYPTCSFYASNNTLNESGKNIIANKLGLMDVNKISATPAEAIKEFIIPLFRGEIETKYSVIEIKALNNIDITDTGENQTKEAGLLRVQYESDDKMIEEIFFAVIQKQIIANQGYNTECIWHIENVCSFSALKGQLDDDLGLFQTMINSMKFDRDWYFNYSYLLDKIESSKPSSPNSIQTLKKIFNDAPKIKEDKEIDKMRNKLTINKKSYESYSRYNTSIKAYIDKNADMILLPSRFNSVWENKEEQYLLSEEQLFNPNKKDSIKWIGLMKNESIILEYYLMNATPI